MNQSSKTHKNKSSSTTAWKQQPKQRYRNPFQDLNNGGSCAANAGGNGNAAAAASSSSSSSVSSVEAPKGCLRFFLSHTSSSSSSAKTPFFNGNGSNGQRPTRVKLLKTPKSAPNVRPDKENLPKRTIFHRPISQKSEKVKLDPFFQSGRKPRSGNVPNLKISSVLGSTGNPENKMKSGSRGLKQVVVGGVSECDISNFTPLNKVVSGFGSNPATGSKVMNEVDDDGDEKSNSNTNTNSASSNTKTPPVQASVSPEIQCGSSMVSVGSKTITPVCYGAGYVVSGVTDKRKCKPRGILTVGEAKPLDCFHCGDEPEQENTTNLVNHSSISMLPLPAEASMHWLESPCNEENEGQKEISDKVLSPNLRLEESAIHNFRASLSSGNNFFSPDLCNGSIDKSISTSSARRKIGSASLLSPSAGFMGPPLYDKADVLCSEEQRKNCNDLDEQSSPLSIDTLSSGNVVQTPQSDSSLDGLLGISWLNADRDRKNHHLDCGLSSAAQHLQMASLSPKSHVSIWDPTSSSFQFDCFTTPSNSVDLTQFQKLLDERTSWFSNSSMENVSQSRMRISWREGLVSRIFEMNEFDSCRCSSDEEDDANDCNDSSLKSLFSTELNVDVANEKISTNGSGHGIDGKAREGHPTPVPCSCAESISTDCGGLIRSEDSDWTICYRNHLFQL